MLYRCHKWPISCGSSDGPTITFILPAYHDDCTDVAAVVDPIHTGYPVAFGNAVNETNHLSYLHQRLMC